MMVALGGTWAVVMEGDVGKLVAANGAGSVALSSSAAAMSSPTVSSSSSSTVSTRGRGWMSVEDATAGGVPMVEYVGTESMTFVQA